VKTLKENDHATAAKALQDSTWYCSGTTETADVQVSVSFKPTMANIVFGSPVKILLENLLRTLPTINAFLIIASDGSKIFDYYEDIPF
jgi:hypothetical protein